MQLKNTSILPNINKILPTGQKVAVALSGGVDSSVAAWLLIQQGYQVEGVFMKNWEEDDRENHCASAADLSDAQAVCDTLGIPLHTVNFSAEYWHQVFEHFLNEYRHGQTPNPDILCNSNIKFTACLRFALEHMHADVMATGHYVRLQPYGSYKQLLRGVDPHKDQSYFLYRLNQQQLSHCIFPLGELHKSQIRNMAISKGLITAYKKESMGICFIGKRKFRDFLSRYLPDNPGIIENTSGQALGTHPGLHYYTIGQRKGLGIGGTKHKKQQPWYVTDKNLSRNVLIVAQGLDHPELLSRGLTAKQLHWIGGLPPKNLPFSCTVKIRYGKYDIPCQLTNLSNDGVTVFFKQAQIAVTPGQSAVFYQNAHCLGGGIISQRIPVNKK